MIKVQVQDIVLFVPFFDHASMRNRSVNEAFSLSEIVSLTISDVNI